MIYKGKNIGNGDVIWHGQRRIKIDSWSPGTGDVWGNYENGQSICLNLIEDELSWWRPAPMFRSRRPYILTEEMRVAD